MKIMLDTNVLISAFVFGEKTGKLISKLFHSEHELYVSEYIDREFRDKKDIPILNDALYHEIDLILSGDKDFLEAGLEKPLVYSPSMMLDYLESK